MEMSLLYWTPESSGYIQNEPRDRNLNFAFTFAIKEIHSNPILKIVFSPYPLVDRSNLFAVVGSNQLSVYDCLPHGVFHKIATLVDCFRVSFYYRKYKVGKIFFSTIMMGFYAVGGPRRGF